MDPFERQPGQKPDRRVGDSDEPAERVPSFIVPGAAAKPPKPPSHEILRDEEGGHVDGAAPVPREVRGVHRDEREEKGGESEDREEQERDGGCKRALPRRDRLSDDGDDERPDDAQHAVEKECRQDHNVLSVSLGPRASITLAARPPLR